MKLRDETKWHLKEKFNTNNYEVARNLNKHMLSLCIDQISGKNMTALKDSTESITR